MSKFDDFAVKNKKLMIVFAGLIIVFTFAVVLLNHFRTSPSYTHKSNEKPFVADINNNLAQQTFVAKTSKQVAQQQREIEKLKRKLEEQQRLMREKEKREREKKKNAPSTVAGIPGFATPGIAQNTNIKGYPPAPKQQVTTPPKPPEPITRQETNAISVIKPSKEDMSFSRPTRFNKQTLNKRSKQTNASVSAIQNARKAQQMSSQTNYQTNVSNKRSNLNKLSNKQKHTGYTIPPGSFVRAYLLTGADVPTSGNGSVGPIPVVFRVVGITQLPNLWKADIKSCFILGQATGSLASERAYIRVDTLSCVTKSGKSVVKKIQGYATGEDGKVGLAGKVVSKQGSMLARTLMAGFISGIGRAFQDSQQTQSISALGTTESIAPDTSKILRYGIGGGVNKAASKLADFYMKMANQMFPVIQLAAGRQTDIIFLQGVKLW